MTTDPATGPLTARAFLLGDDTETAAALRRALRDDGIARSALRGVRWLSASAATAVDDEIGRALGGLLELDLGDALVAGWCKHRDLRAAGDRTHRDPSSREVVALASHRVAWAHQPRVDLFVDEVLIHTLTFELSIVFDLTGVSAVVWRGHLVALEGGECLVTAALALEGRQLVARRGHVDLGWLVPLRRTVPLWSADATTGSAPPPPPADASFGGAQEVPS
jgi:hypothetical protein